MAYKPDSFFNFPLYSLNYRIKFDKLYNRQLLEKQFKRQLNSEKEICPISFCKIQNEYCLCKVCKNAFDYKMLTTWLLNKPSCPMCRNNWHDPVKYII